MDGYIDEGMRFVDNGCWWVACNYGGYGGNAINEHIYTPLFDFDCDPLNF
jgi:hypothetical protein